jgi:DNA modification methylase
MNSDPVPATGLQIVRVPIDSVYEDPANTRLHGERNLESIVNSLRRWGQVEPLVVRKGDRRIIGGNGRHVAMKKLGWTECEIVEVDVTDSQAAALSIALNRTAELAEWDEQALATMLNSLQAEGFDVGDIGFDDAELAALLDGLDIEPGGSDPDLEQDEIPEPPAEPFTKRGDLWLLGEHRLLCGDCTNPEDVRRVMKGERAILFATDPPYLVDYDGTNHPTGSKSWADSYGITWDDSSQGPELYDAFIQAALDHATLPNAAIYIWHASKRQAMLEAVLTKHDILWHQQIIWAKDRPVMVRMHYRFGHEPCCYGWKRGNRPPRLAGADMPSTVWALKGLYHDERPEHPTPKPLDCFGIPMRQHVEPGGLCYEPFSGSGTQIIAAEQLRRRCYSLEIEPRYVDVAVERWCRLTGKQAVRESDGAVFPVDSEEVAA